MATTNPVSQVLIASGNQAILAAGSRPDALANGQIGFFNYHTGLSIDGSSSVDAKDIFIAVGINRTTGGTDAAEDIQVSAGQMIQVRNTKSIGYRGYQTATQQVVEITGFSAYCDTDYTLNIEYRNPQIFQLQGYNAFKKPYSFHTDCCAPTADCEQCRQPSDPVDLAVGLIENINNDDDGLVTASLFAWRIQATVTAGASASGNLTVTVGSTSYTVAVTNGQTAAQVASAIATAINTQASSPYRASVSTATLTIYGTSTNSATPGTFALTSAGGTGVTVGSIVAGTKVDVTDPTTFQSTYDGASVGIRITTVAESRPAANGGINTNYHKTGTSILVSFAANGSSGFSACNGVITEITAPVFNEGSGYDIQQLEYIDGGWNGKPGPYRQLAVTGLARNGMEYFSSAGGTYSTFSIRYDQFSVGGWLEYYNNLETVIAIPCADSTTLTGFATVADLIFTQFGAMANDVAANGDCTNAATSTLTAATDGIESLG